MKNFRIPFVFTKFNNFIQDVQTKMATDDQDTSDIDLVLSNIKKGLDHFRVSIEANFTNPAFFVYDPNAENFFINEQMVVQMDESLLDEPGSTYYRIESDVIEKIRSHIR